MTDGSKVINREIFALWTGRFQPPHNGHFEILKHSIKILEVPHVAVLSSYFGWESKGVYGAHAEVAYEKSRNPLSTWERFWLMRLGLQSFDLLEQVSVIVAPRHDLDWPGVSQFYPSSRIICLTIKDEFEAVKAELWRHRGESVHVFREFDASRTLTTTAIRKAVRDGADWRSYLPEATHSFFQQIDGPRRVFDL